MKNVLRVSHSDRTIIMDRTFAKLSENTMSAEYAHLQQVRLHYPLYQVVQRHIRKNTNQEHYHGLTYRYMEDYSCITPSASGGQPMQAITMRKDDIPVAVSTVVLAIVTITYKLVLVAVGTVVMLLCPGEIMSHLEGVENLVYLGLALNIGCIAILLMMVFRPSVVRRCAEGILGGLNRIRAFKHPEKISGKLNSVMNQYAGAADYYRTHKIVIVNVLRAVS